MKVATKTRGRPTVFDYDAVRKLEQAFAIGCTVEEACSISGVSRSAYYKKLEDDTQFMDKMERAKLFMIIQARHTVYNAIRAGDIKTSMWYLERKRKDEFSTKTELTIEPSLQLDNFTDKELIRLAG
jgi:ACT domain-containing protein